MRLLVGSGVPVGSSMWLMKFSGIVIVQPSNAGVIAIWQASLLELNWVSAAIAKMSISASDGAVDWLYNRGGSLIWHVEHWSCPLQMEGNISTLEAWRTCLRPRPVGDVISFLYPSGPWRVNVTAKWGKRERERKKERVRERRLKGRWEWQDISFISQEIDRHPDRKKIQGIFVFWVTGNTKGKERTGEHTGEWVLCGGAKNGFWFWVILFHFREFSEWFGGWGSGLWAGLSFGTVASEWSIHCEGSVECAVGSRNKTRDGLVLWGKKKGGLWLS